jgi:hypothetical protein
VPVQSAEVVRLFVECSLTRSNFANDEHRQSHMQSVCVVKNVKTNPDITCGKSLLVSIPLFEFSSLVSTPGTIKISLEKFS